MSKPLTLDRLKQLELRPGFRLVRITEGSFTRVMPAHLDEAVKKRNQIRLEVMTPAGKTRKLNIHHIGKTQFIAILARDKDKAVIDLSTNNGMNEKDALKALKKKDVERGFKSHLRKIAEIEKGMETANIISGRKSMLNRSYLSV